MAVSREPVFYDQYGDRLLWERNRAHDSDQTIVLMGALAPLLQPVDPRFVYAGPTAAPGLASFRRLQIADIEDLRLFSNANDGLTPQSDGGTTNYLRADGRWATPPNLGTISTDLDVINRTDQGFTLASSSGGDAVLPMATPALAGLITGADQDKLNSIERGATANSPDAALRDRSTHTGTQPASTITGLAPSATIDTTDAANISRGVLNHQRLPVFAGLNPGAVPASLGAAKPEPWLYLREDGSWGAPLSTVEATLPLTVNRVPGGLLRLAINGATASTAGAVRGSTAAEVAALYVANGTPGPGAANAAITLESAQGTLMPFDQRTLKPAATASLSSTVPLGVGGESQSATLGQLRDVALGYQQPGPGAVRRQIVEKITEYCSFNEYINMQLCLNSHSHVVMPAGDYVLNEEVNFPRSGITLQGVGMGVTRLKAAPTMIGHMLRLAGIYDCTFSDFSIDGNENERRLGIGSGFNCFNVQGGRNRFFNIEVFGAPFYGLLIDGVAGITSFSNEVRNSFIRDNGGTGLCLGGALLTTAIGNVFRNNGFENLTIDLNSHNSSFIGNHFYTHRGGCGNIGWDDSDHSLFMGNFIDSENTAAPTVNDRNGICINSQTGVTSGCSIVGNIILNNRDHGIWFRDRSGEAKKMRNPWWWNPSRPGSAVISNNYLRGNGIDMRLDNTDELIVATGNNYSSLAINDPDAFNIRLGAGEVYAEAQVQQRQVFPVNQWTKVNFSPLLYARGVELIGGTDFIPVVGGFMQIDCQIRLDVMSEANDIEYIQLRLTTPWQPRIKNIEFGPRPSVVDVEIDISFSKLLPKGPISAWIYPAAPSGGGQAVCPPGAESWFSLVLAG